MSWSEVFLQLFWVIKCLINEQNTFMRTRALKKEVTRLLKKDDVDQIFKDLLVFPPDKLIKPLLSSLCSCDEIVKWHAVSAIGQVVSQIAETEFESARVMMRRCMWMLSDESGGIGWGIPEAIGEVTACHPQIAHEYAHILVSFMREDGFFLELPELQRGLMWGIGRLAQVNPELLKEKSVVSYLPFYLNSEDILVLAGSVYTAGLLKAKEVEGSLTPLLSDKRQVIFYDNFQLIKASIGQIASEALEILK